MSEKNVDNLKHELTISNTTINCLKKKLELHSVNQIQLDQHIQGLNNQIDELSKKLITSNSKYSETVEKFASLHDTISSLKNVSYSYLLFFFFLRSVLKTYYEL